AWQIWGRITCPTFLIRGGESWATDPEKDGRAQAFRNATVVTVPNAGHWVHHHQLDHFLRVVRELLGISHASPTRDYTSSWIQAESSARLRALSSCPMSYSR